MKKNSQKSKGDGSLFGVTTGKKMGQFFVDLMEAQKKDRLSDDELAEVLTREFPKGSSDYRNHIRLYRSMYNNGKWGVQQKTYPDFFVHKYVNKKPQITHTGPRAKCEQ